MTATQDERARLLLRLLRAACRQFGGRRELCLAHEVVTRGDAARELFARVNFATPEERQAFVDRHLWIRKEN